MRVLRVWPVVAILEGTGTIRISLNEAVTDEAGARVQGSVPPLSSATVNKSCTSPLAEAEFALPCSDNGEP